jgi:hypothetical protein
MALRERLQQLAAKEGIKPSRAAQLRKARKAQEERAEREAEEMRTIKGKSYVDEIATECEPD